MNCPLCGKVARTSNGLRKHLEGTRPYGGHELIADEAAFAIAAAQLASATDADRYLERALSNLVRNKQLPKYPFERGVDAFLGVFLPDIVAQLLDEDAIRLVAQEFPLKKLERNLSTNIDYVLVTEGQDERPWVFLELKTDSSSLNTSQALIYAERLVHTPMSQLLADVEVIMGASGKGPKYQALLDLFSPYEPCGGVRVIYLTPEPTSAAELLPKGVNADLALDFSSIVTCSTFSDLLVLELTNYPHSWQLFRDEVVSEIVGQALE